MDRATVSGTVLSGVRVSSDALAYAYNIRKALKGSAHSMRLKYKKLILIFTVAIMLIGLSMFSLIAPSIDFSSKGSDKKTSHKDNPNSVVADMTEGEIRANIALLVTNYLDAKQRVDMDGIAECVSDVERVDNKRLVAEAEYIEAYKNIDCTIKEGPEDGTYRVYVYYEAKVYDIDTLCPSLTALYITVDKEGNFKIYLGTVDAETQEAIDKLDNSEEIKNLADSVQKKLEGIVSSNEAVRDFYEMLESTNDSNEEIEDNENIDKEGGGAPLKPAN